MQKINHFFAIFTTFYYKKDLTIKYNVLYLHYQLQIKKNKKMETLTAGTKVKFTPTGNIFEIAKVTDKRISWYVGLHKSNYGHNKMQMTWMSLKAFKKGIEKGTYIIIN